MVSLHLRGCESGTCRHVRHDHKGIAGALPCWAWRERASPEKKPHQDLCSMVDESCYVHVLWPEMCCGLRCNNAKVGMKAVA
jgi:hypothetical protein